MSSIFQSFRTTNQALPVSQPAAAAAVSKEQGLRRRLSSLSLNIQPISSPATSWAFRRSKSVSAMSEYAGSSIMKWWEWGWGWGWILSRKPTFARDLEMNEEEKVLLGDHNKGSWRHVFYKVRSEFRRLIGSENMCLPQCDYSQNFKDGKRIQAQI